MLPPSLSARLARHDVILAALASLALLSLMVAPLATPFWWDAGAVYAPGAQWLATHGFDARPGVFPSDLSRGHTELYYLCLAAVFRLLGATPAVGHGLTLAFSTAALTGTYALGKRLFGRAQGALAALLLAFSPLYLTMSSEALPEIPITALTVLALAAFARGNIVQSALWSTALVLFKETGIACPLAITLTLALRAQRLHRSRESLVALGVSLAPVAVLVGFFLWQKRAEGWWVLPYHAGLFHEARSLSTQLWRVVRSIFTVDGRAIALTAALALAALRALRREAPLGAATPDRDTLTALALVALQNVGFFTKMFFLERYTLPVHPGVAIVIAGALLPVGAPLRRWGPGLLAGALTLVVAVAHRDVGRDVNSGETNFRYRTAVRAYGALYARLEARGGAPVVLTTWPMTDALRSPFLGWVRRPYRVVSYPWYRDGGTHPPIDVLITAEGLGDHRALLAEARALGMHRAERVVERGAAIELWTR